MPRGKQPKQPVKSKKSPVRKKAKGGVVGYRDEMLAERWVSVGDSETGFERVKQVMRVSLGLTTSDRGDGRFYYANGVCNDDEAGAIRVSVNTFGRDITNMMFKAAIERIGFKIVEGK